MVVVKEFAAEFQIEFAAELRDALSDVGGLQLDVFFVVEFLAHRGRHPFPNDVVNGKIIPDIVGNKKWDPPMKNPIRHREQLLPLTKVKLVLNNTVRGFDGSSDFGV